MSQNTNTDLMCTVVSIVPYPIRETKPGLIPNLYEIEASNGIDPHVLHVAHAQHYVYIDDTRPQLLVRDSPDEVAKSIVYDYKSSQLAREDGIEPGIFWVIGKHSVEEIKKNFSKELADARISQQRWLLALCKIADDDWQRYQKHTVISDTQRTAARILKLRAYEHPWMAIEQSVEADRCPNCSIPLGKGQAVCHNCRAVIDATKAKSISFA